MKCLYELNYKLLKELVKEKLNLENWLIRNQDIRRRKDAISYSDRYAILKKRASDLSFFYSNTEIVSWLDTLSILLNVFDIIDDEYLQNNIQIFQEYCIPFSNKRADYLLAYDNKILILEFSFDKLGYEFNYETKLRQAIGYKELLSNILPHEVDIGTYTFLIEPEESENGKVCYVNDGNNLPNDRKIKLLAEYIEHFFKKNINLAVSSLKKRLKCAPQRYCSGMYFYITGIVMAKNVCYNGGKVVHNAKNAKNNEKAL